MLVVAVIIAAAAIGGCTVAVARAEEDSVPYVMPAVAGICSGDAGVGVGCGFDSAYMTSEGLTLSPKKSVLRMPWCAEHCYATCPPTYPIPYECDQCVYQDNTGNCYRTAYNVQASAAPTQGGCYETEMYDTVANWSKTKVHSKSSHGFFSSKSKTTTDFYSMYFRRNYSMSLSFKYIISHSVTLASSAMYPAPSREFELASLLLPASYKGNEQVYADFIDSFGTHYMSEAFMGGSALLTNYFHSCFLHTFSSHEVVKASSSSFAMIFSDSKASGWGSSIDKSKWDSWSQIDLKLLGGDAADYANLGVNDKLTGSQVRNWQSTISGANNLVPLTYTIRPITDVMKGGWIDASISSNVEKALDAYGAQIKVQMQQLENQLVAKNEYKKPKWCKPSKPPHHEGRRRATNLPGCPALPPPYFRAESRQIERHLSSSTQARGPLPSSSMPPIPGLVSAAGDLGSLFSRGYDPLQQAVRAPVVAFHFDGWACKNSVGRGSTSGICSNVWTDPATGVQFRRPDEIQIFNSPAAHADSSNRLLVTTSDYKKWHWSQHSTSIGIGVFSYSHSDASSYVSQILDTQRAVIAVKRRQVIAYRMTMWDQAVLRCEMQPTCKAASPKGTYSEPGTQVASSFALQRQALPASCSPNSAGANQYKLFRQAFGTHYVGSATYGGSLEFMLVINSSLYTKMTAMQVSEQTSIGFSLLSVAFGFSHGKNVSTEDVTREFRQNTQVVLLSYGGNPLLLQEGDYRKWAQSVPANPAPVNSTYAKITDLFDGNDPRRKCMMREVDEYLASKPPRRYRCGDAAGIKVLDGIPRPSSSSLHRLRRRVSTQMHKFEFGSLPTLEEIAGLQHRDREADILRGKNQTAIMLEAEKIKTAGPSSSQVAARALLKQQEDGACVAENVIPGASANDILGKTFDIKLGQPRLLATPLTCKQSKLWYSPFTQKTYQIPDQVDFVDVSAACQEEVMNSITNETTAWKMAAESWGFSLSVGIPIGSGSLSVGVGFEKQITETARRMSNFTKSSTILSRKMSMYRITFGNAGSAPLAIGSQMQLALANLPVVSSYAKASVSQRKIYDTFVRSFGTHYVVSADFGAHCAFNSLVDKTFASKMTSKYVSEQISISLGIQMKGIGIGIDLGFGMTKGSSVEDQQFKLHSQSLRDCSGGNTALLTQDPPKYDEWVQSAFLAPAFINGTTVLRPLTDLLVGANAASKRSALEDAILAYVHN